MSDSKGDKMDMSLDDIIQLTRKSGGSGRGRGRGDRSGGGGGFQRRGRGGGSRGGGQFQRRRSDGGSERFPRGGGVQRRWEGGSAGAPYSRPRQVPDVWKHDLYEESSSSAARSAMPPPQRSLHRDSDKRSPKLIISNLDFGVNDQDIEELFGEFGTLKRFAVHYDKSGRSLGTADVEYEHMAEAIKAMKQYNNVPLDGKPMKIELEGDTGKIALDRPRTMSSRLGQPNHSGNGGVKDSNRDFVPRRRQSFENNDRRNQGRGRRGQGQRGRGQGQRGRDQGAVPSKEDLDAELDAYNAKMETE